MKDLAVYTAITSKYDDVKNHVDLPGDLFIFTNDNIQNNQYRILPCLNLFKSNNRNAKIHKILAHSYFPDYEYTLWVDGNIRIKEDISSLIDEWKKHDLSMFRHGQRTCLFEEADVCSAWVLDRPHRIAEQVERYKAERFPEKYGLWCGGIIFRNNRVKDFNEFWWKEICAGSKRDQISLPYALWKCGVTVNDMQGEVCFETYPHIRLPTIN